MPAGPLNLFVASREEVSDLEVLFYIGRNNEFGEHYENMLEHTVAEHRHTESRWENVYHIMTKLNLLPSVIAGVEQSGRPTLAGKLRTIRPEPTG